MRKSLKAQGEGKIPGFPSTGRESDNTKAIDGIANDMKDDGGIDGRYLTREHLGLYMVSVYFVLMPI